MGTLFVCAKFCIFAMLFPIYSFLVLFRHVRGPETLLRRLIS
jgi:hypothetical protein